MTLDELNSIESELLTVIKNTSGLIEEKLEQLQQLGIFEKYSLVFEEYSNLIDCEIEGTEALKRSVFLKWYEFAEPSFLSGIENLSKNISLKIFEKLTEKIKNESLDYELQWMLNFYFQIADFAFYDFIDIKIIPTIENKEIWENRFYDTTQFENRGQMGIYWISVVEANKERLNFEVRKNDRKNSEK